MWRWQAEEAWLDPEFVAKLFAGPDQHGSSSRAGKFQSMVMVNWLQNRPSLVAMNPEQIRN